MAQALCKFPDLGKKPKLGKRKRAKNIKLPDQIDDEVPLRNFPSSKELANINESCFLENYQPILGYRAMYILQLAKDVEAGRVSLQDLENSISDRATQCEDVYQKLVKISGFGPYTCANVLMCIGYYENVPADTETIRHIREVQENNWSCSYTLLNGYA